MQFEINVQSVQNWGNGGNGKITIKNNGPAISNWEFQLATNNFVIDDFWALSKVGTNNNILVKPSAWKTSIGAGEILESGFSYRNTSAVTTLQVSTTTPGIKIVSPTPSNPIPQPGDTNNLTTNKKIFGYFTEWSIYDRQFSVDMIPAKQLTHILYAFTLPNPSQADYNLLASNYKYPPKPYHPEIAEGTMVFQDEYAVGINIPKLKQLKTQYPNLKVLISIGGWSFSWIFSKIFANSTTRTNLVRSSVKYVIDNGFDGLDIDWEYPGKKGMGYNYVDEINDTPNFITFLKELRAELDSKSPNKHLEITAAMGTNPDVIKNYLGTEPYFDYINIMAYDYAGDWGDGGHLAALYDNPGKTENSQFNVNSAVINTQNIGFKPSKIILGCPMYGRGWSKIVPTDPANPIFGKNVSGPAISYSGSAGEPGMTSFRHLRNVVNQKGLVRYYDNIAKAVYIHNSNTGETWTYEDDQTIKNKAHYVLDNKLGGIMVWELSDDTRDGSQNILNAAVNVLNLSQPTDPTPPVDNSRNISVTITNNDNNDFVLKQGEFVTITNEGNKLQFTNTNTTNLIIKPAESLNITYKSD